MLKANNIWRNLYSNNQKMEKLFVLKDEDIIQITE